MGVFLVATVALAATPAPLSAAAAAIFRGSPQEQLRKEACTADRRVELDCKDEISYVFSNEMEHRVFRPYIDGIGGAYVGVGADQGLTFVAWGRAELAWMMDYDLEVVRLNRIHLAFVRRAETAEQFCDLWRERRRPRAERIIRAAFLRNADDQLAVWDRHRATVFRHLKSRRRRGAATPGHWLDRAEDYAYIRALVRAGRVRVVKGDLLKKKTLRGIGAAATELGVPVRIVYLSNAEEFWHYPRAFRDNIGSLPMDDRSVILRLRHNGKFAPRLDGSYAYAVHHGPSFQRDLADRSYGVVDHFLRKAQTTDAGLMLIDMPAATARSAATTTPEG